MKISLCTVSIDSGQSKHDGQLPMMPKIAIVSLIKWMEKYGYSSETYDFYDIDMLDPSDSEIKEYFESYQPDIVGLSAVVSTSYFEVKRISSILRQACPDAWIVMGGNLSASSNVILRKSEVDICVHGDGEIPWVNFIEYVNKYGKQKIYSELLKIKGLSYIHSNEDLQFTDYGDNIPDSDNPFPDYDILKSGLKNKPEMLKNYFKNGVDSDWFNRDYRSFETNKKPKLAGLWLSKGCVGRCTFCQRSTKGAHCFDLDKFNDHLIMLKEQYNVGFIFILDENFGFNKKHTYQAAKILKKHDMLWICGGVRCTSVNADDVEFYYNCGCSGLKFGVESGSQKILDLMEKRFTIEQVEKAVGYCNEKHIYSPIAVMVGMPGDTDRTVIETGRFVGRLSYLQSFTLDEASNQGVFYALPLPGTPLYEYGQQLNIIGTLPEAEEEYLKIVSSRGADKINYINLNGSSMKTVLFWDILLNLEAVRTYYRLQRKGIKKIVPAKKKETISDKEISVAHSLFYFMKKILIKIREEGIFRATGKYYFSVKNRIKRKFITSLFIAKLPRPLIYNLSKNIIYLFFLFEKAAFKIMFWFNKRHGKETLLPNIYKNYMQPEPLTDEFQLENFRWKSLREIVNIRREKQPADTTVTEKNRRLLTRGR